MDAAPWTPGGAAPTFSARGYEIWAEAIKDDLKKLLK
jgi:hypothetical protein